MIVWSKIQALGPAHIFEGPLKGHGFLESLDNQIILNLRDKNFEVYVDYFTFAKSQFYLRTQGYESCSISIRTNKMYKDIVAQNIKNGNRFEDKYKIFSIPVNLVPAIGRFAILTEKIKDIEKNKFQGTNIYNIKGMLDDSSLKTV